MLIIRWCYVSVILIGNIIEAIRTFGYFCNDVMW